MPDLGIVLQCVFQLFFIAAICLNLPQIIVSQHTETVSNNLVTIFFCAYRMTSFSC